MTNADNTATKQRVVGRPFPKGVSGNPAGRPKRSFSIKDAIRQTLEANPDKLKEVVQYFIDENRELMWQMLEGSPRSVTNLKVEETDKKFTDDEMEAAKEFIVQRLNKTHPQ